MRCYLSVASLSHLTVSVFGRLRLPAPISTRNYATTAAAPPLVVLRPYQEACLDACLDALAKGSTRIGVSLPTGSGKTTVFISLLSRLSAPKGSDTATQSLIIVNSIELARQAAAQASALHPQWSVEIEQGQKYQASGTADITVATYQTLLRARRLEKFKPYSLKAIIVDEAHHAAAPSYRRIISHFDPEVKNPDPTFQAPATKHIVPIIGFSATFSRHDGLALGSVFQRIVYHRDFLEMIKEQWLCDVRFTSVKANIDLKNVTIHSRTGDFNATSLAHVVNTEVVNELVVRSWLDKAADRKSTLVFCVNIAHVRHLTYTFRKFGIDARYVYSATPAAERKHLVQEFKQNKYPVLINCAILTEGADIPNIDCVVIARPTRSRNVFAQMIGRGMRLSRSTGKIDCRIIDFVDSTQRVAGVISTPTLFGLNPEELVDDASLEELDRRASESVVDDDDGPRPPRLLMSGNLPDPKTVSYHDYENPWAMNASSHGDPNIHKLSSNAWVSAGGGVYVLECLGKGYIRVDYVEATDEEEGHYCASFNPVLKFGVAANRGMSPYLRSRVVLTAKELVETIRGCDTYAVNKIVKGPLALGLLRSARWRKESATTNQKALIRKRWEKRVSVEQAMRGDPSNVETKIARLTKGEAANIITRLKHGAQARYNKRKMADDKIEKATVREQLRQAREVVKEGVLSQ